MDTPLPVEPPDKDPLDRLDVPQQDGDEPSAFSSGSLAPVDSERPMAPRLRAWLDHDRHQDFLLQGEELAQGLRWAQTRTDTTQDEREFLLQSERVALDRLRAQQEGEQVRGTLVQAEERRRQRRLLRRAAAGAIVCYALLLSAIGWLYRDAARARAQQAAAEREQARLRGEQEQTVRVLDGIQRNETKLVQKIETLNGQLVADQRDMDQVRRELGGKEARLRDMTGKVTKIAKKRIVTKGPGRSLDTGYTDQTVEEVLLLRGWPVMRTCFPVLGPVPQQMGVEVQVQPEGTVSEAELTRPPPGLSAQGSQCLVDALRGLRFPAFSGAYFIRIGYDFARAERSGAGPAKPGGKRGANLVRHSGEAGWWPFVTPAKIPAKSVVFVKAR